MNDATLRLAVVGAGPVGLALALHAARALPQADVTVFDARPADKDVSADPRILALALGSVQLLERLGAWRAGLAQPILEVHVSQAPPSAFAGFGQRFGEPELRIRADAERVPFLGAVLSYGAIVAPLQSVWSEAQRAEPKRLHSRFGTPVTALKNVAEGVEVDAGIAECFDLAVVAEGGVFADADRRLAAAHARPALRHDYRQTAWVGQVGFETGSGPRAPGVAFERFTRHGPAALLPLRDGRAALIWCVASDDDPVHDLDDAQRIAVLNTVFHPASGRIATITPLKAFALGLSAERTLTDGRSVRIGNAAQTLHPVAGQGLNLGLRDAFELVRALEQAKRRSPVVQAPRETEPAAGEPLRAHEPAKAAGFASPAAEDARRRPEGAFSRDPDIDAVLRTLEWQRAPDRWALIAATDFLARSFTWTLPGAGAARGLGLAALQALGPLKSALARQMMYGSR